MTPPEVEWKLARESCPALRLSRFAALAWIIHGPDWWTTISCSKKLSLSAQRQDVFTTPSRLSSIQSPTSHANARRYRERG